MNKILISSLILFILSPLETLFMIIWGGFFPMIIAVPFAIVTAILMARFIDNYRDNNYPDMNIFVFILYAYVPGLLGAVIFMIWAELENTAGVDFSVYQLVACAAVFSQLLLTMAGAIAALRSRLKE